MKACSIRSRSTPARDRSRTIRPASPLGDLDHGRVVEQRQRLERRVRPEPARAGLHAAGRVEGRQERERRGPPEEGVEPAADSGSGPASAFHSRFIWPSVMTPSGWGGKTLGPPIRAASSPLHASAASRISSASSRSRACRQSKPVVGIDRLPLRPHARRLPVGRRGHDQAVDLLEAPAALHELAGQPVEQLRMARRRSLGAEVVVGLDQAAAEVGLPDPVDRHPGRQRIAAIDQPPGQVHPVGRRARARIRPAAERPRAPRERRRLPSA